MLKLSRIVFGMVLVFAVAIACEAPAGSEGPQGPQGEAGPIGPAGENGSVMYAGQGAPTVDIGSEGDYYLNTTTGEYYGPKDDDWGNPIIVLMGEDGQDGADGADGEDGSQIYSGNGVPDASMGVEGDYYLDKDSYELYGPKTANGWGTPINLKGADGNANVTRYIFPGHDFSSEPSVTLTISNNYFMSSAFKVYLRVVEQPYVTVTNKMYHIPGWGSSTSQYKVQTNVTATYALNNYSTKIIIDLADGSGEAYDNIYVVRIEANNTEDMTKQKSQNIMPDHLDTSDYNAVAKYYGFYK